MARLFWVGVGAVGAVVVTRRLREKARRYTPEGVAERVEAAGDQASAAVTAAARRFRTARAERERDLVESLFVTPEGDDPYAVVGRRGAGRARAAHGDEAARGDAGGARPAGRVDPDEPLYDF